MTWQTKAACGTADPALFDPPALDQWRRVQRAFLFCRRCDVNGECLFAAMRDRDSGIRGLWVVADGRVVPTPQRPVEPARRYTGHGTVGRFRQHIADGESPCVACVLANRRAETQRRYHARKREARLAS